MNRLLSGLTLLAMLAACRSDVTLPKQQGRASFSTAIGRAYAVAPTGASVTMSNGGRASNMSETSYGIAPSEKLNGAIAWLIRDPQASQKRLVVLSKQDVSDGLYVMTRHLMYRDLEAFPVANGRRVIKLYKDQQVQIEEAGVIRRTNVRMATASVSTHIGPELLRRHDKARKIQVDGIGEVRLVQE